MPPAASILARADSENFVAVTLIARDMQTPTRDARVEGDTLSFVFNEPEAGVLLTCALARQADERSAGRCVDAEGKWAHFTMTPPGE